MADIRYNNQGITVPIFVTMEMEYFYTLFSFEYYPPQHTWY